MNANSDIQADITKFLKGNKVILLTCSLQPGAGERQATIFARYLRDKNLKVEIWNAQKREGLELRSEELAISRRVVPVPLPWSNNRLRQLLRLLRFAWILRQARPDVIVAYGSSLSVACGLVWRLTGSRAFIWNECSDKRERVGGRPEQLATRLTPAFIADSEGGAEFLTDALGVDDDRVRVVHSGVELDPPEMDRVAWRRHLEVDDDSFVACMFANLKRSKDHATLIRAWRIVVDRLELLNRKAVLVLAGRFDETHNLLKATCYDLELFDNVRFPGEVKDLSGLASAVDLCVHTAVSETCPPQVLACMAAGLPVVGADYAGLREAVGPAGSPFVATPGNADELADRILKLATNSSLRTEVGAANRQRIGSEFSKSRMCEQTLAVISNCLLPSSSHPRDVAVCSKSSEIPLGTARDV